MKRFLPSSALRWRWLAGLMLAFAVLGLLALPRGASQESALTIRPERRGQTLPDGFFVYQTLDQRGIRIKSITPENDTLIIRLASPQQQQQAREALSLILPQGYTVGLRAVAAEQAWVKKLALDHLRIG
ncbi:EnvZ/OmpR regulon moderator MzrA [Nissabacter sp. SGAir0207]|uniref:EnvZ/OmpR regulon moderator MzrA n=1 Tax=Nissabacter sp. SGAir0207 TaxID=2126321 RepID=UPI0010CD36D3|nr:modulator protein [Nissabacter sp. SGAir0207]